MPASLNPMVTYGVLCNESTYRSICGKYSPCYVTVGVQKGTIPYQTDIELSKVNTSLYFENNRVEREEQLNNLILKVIMTLILICSCFYLAISLFMNHLIINDMVPTVVKSTAVTNALEDTCQNVLSMMNMDESQSQALVSSLQQDEKTQELVNEYIDTVLNNQSSTLDETLLKQVLEDKKDEVYSILNPSINEETFTTLYDQAINQMDLQGLQDKVLSRVENTMEQSGETYKIVKKVYSFKNSTHIIVSAILLVISTAYLIFISYQDRLITKCLSVSYMVCGIMTFLISFAIILGLTAMASSTMTIQLTSIRYMYICGASYFFVGIILLIVNAFLKKKNRYHYYY